jgi:undecaprenyl-diphosphatase
LTTIEAIVLGIIQGLTEFLPVSSSGHLKLAQHLLGFQNLDHYIPFDLICHMGTLCAIFIVFKTHISSALSHDRARLLQIFVGTLPLLPILLVLKPLESLYDQIHLLGYFFLTTALLLFAGIHWGHEKPPIKTKKHRYRDAFLIGTFQTLALLPGISRSGSTISCARLLGWKSEDAITFSFLLAIPAILGGTVLKLSQLFLNGPAEQEAIGAAAYASGFAASFIMGVFALKLLMKLAAKQKMVYFVYYCLFLGVGTLIYFSSRP